MHSNGCFSQEQCVLQRSETACSEILLIHLNLHRLSLVLIILEICFTLPVNLHCNCFVCLLRTYWCPVPAGTINDDLHATWAQTQETLMSQRNDYWLLHLLARICWSHACVWLKCWPLSVQGCGEVRGTRLWHLIAGVGPWTVYEVDIQLGVTSVTGLYWCWIEARTLDWMLAYAAFEAASEVGNFSFLYWKMIKEGPSKSELSLGNKAWLHQAADGVTSLSGCTHWIFLCG